jgi:hypothetical protein
MKWRIGEMLMFYGSHHLLNGDDLKAYGFFGVLTQLEPDNEQAKILWNEVAMPRSVENSE